MGDEYPEHTHHTHPGQRLTATAQPRQRAAHLNDARQQGTMTPTRGS